MLADMLKSSITTMNLRVTDHAILLVPQAKDCVAVHKRDNDSCHVCGFRVPGMMEIDHLKGHRKSDTKDLATICQFCHNLKHPLWAGARGRIVPIFAPDMTQEDLHRLAWVTLAWRDADADADPPVDVSAILDDIESRRGQITEMVGCRDAESLFEAALGLPALLGDKEAAQLLMGIDQGLRFWPAEVTFDHLQLAAGARLSSWGLGGFEVKADQAARAIRNGVQPDFHKIRAAAEAALVA